MHKDRSDKVLESMKANLESNTGKSLEQWIEIINAQALTRTSEKVKFLKTAFGLGRGYAGMIIFEAKASEDRSAFSPEELLRKQYVGKETLIPIYEKLVETVQGFGADVEIVECASYVSVRRSVQIAMFSPVTKTRLDIMLKLKKNQESSGILEALAKPSTCTHRIKLSTPEEISPELIGWLKEAYLQAAR